MVLLTLCSKQRFVAYLGRRNQQGGPRRGQRGGRRNQQWRPAVNPTTFEGRKPTLKGHIYDLTGERNNDHYVKTTREIENWVGPEYTKHVGDFCEAVSDLSLATPILPTTPASDTGADFEIWKLELKDAREKIIAYESFNARLYRIVLGQCSEALHDRLKSHTEFPSALNNGIALLKVIKKVTYTFEERRYTPEALLDVRDEFHRLQQGPREPLQRYYERFKNQVEVMDAVGVNIVDQVLVDEIADANNHITPSAGDRDEAYDRTMAAHFVPAPTSAILNMDGLHGRGSRMNNIFPT